jgi:branched-chain amino acid transport system ATP-binding protein
MDHDYQPPGSRLSARRVVVEFSGLRALDGVDLTLGSDEIVGLIGPNGAGKTTLVNVLSGFQRPTEGGVELDGRDVTGLAPPQRARAGLVRTFQSGRPFAGLTVGDNVELGALGVGEGRRVARKRAGALLEQVGLAGRAGVLAAALSAGEERRMGIARALAGHPRFLLLDEPAAGLNEAESDSLVATLADLQRELSFGLLVIEHDMRLIMSLCRRIQVLDFGRTIAIGTPAEVQRDPAVLTAYLGTDVAEAAPEEVSHASG